MGNGGKNRWRITFNRSQSALKPKIKNPPKEFLCPISGSLMVDPVIVASGQTLERNCVQVCKNLGFTPILSDSSKPDFSTIIPNIAIKSMILNWCDCYSLDRPKPLEFGVIEKIVRTLMESQQAKIVVSEKELLQAVTKYSFAVTELNRQSPIHCDSSSDESVTISSSSSEIVAEETLNLNSHLQEEEEIFVKLKSSQVSDQEEAVIRLRNITRTNQEIRIPLCTPRLLSAVRSLLISRYSSIQINSVAALVNLSLENVNKVKIVRSRFVPTLIEVLKRGYPEAQEHAVSVLFSLALEDENKTVIGVLGALPPLLNSLRSESERVRIDSVLALYHLSLVQSNRSKLVKLGAIPSLLGMTKRRDVGERVLQILCNVAVGSKSGRAAMLDAGAVKCFVELLSGSESDSEVTRASCVEALYELSCGTLRFKGLAKEAGAVEVLREVAERGSERERTREKAKKILEMMRGRGRGGQEEEEVVVVDWESLLDSGVLSRNCYQLDGEKKNS